MKIAALDLGTNTFLCLIVEVEQGRILRVLSDQARVVRLGQGVHQNRQFHVEALARADACLADYAAEIRRHSVDRIVAAATSAARDVSNGYELLRIGARNGMQIEIISGQREAECTYWGTVGCQLDSEALVGIIDVGGGSTEFIVGDANGILKKISVDVGSVRMTEQFITGHPISFAEMQKMQAQIHCQLEKVRSDFAKLKPNKIIAVAGTPTTLAALDQAKPFDPIYVDGYQISVTKLKYWEEQLAEMTIQQRQALVGMDSARADVIVAGTMALRMGCEALGLEQMRVSIRGLRYGLALATVGPEKSGHR